MRSWNALAAVALIAGLTAGCSSSSSSTPTGSTLLLEREADAEALIVQCALTSGLMKPPTGLSTPSGIAPFVEGTKLVITGANAGVFNDWYTGIVEIVIAGKKIEDWDQQIASSGKLPAALCGTSMTAYELQKQVYASDRAAANPWARG